MALSESFKISSELPIWLALLCILIAVAVVYLTYGKESKLKPENKFLRYSLYFLRGTLAFLLAFLILKPFVKSGTRHIEEAELVIGIDNSASIAMGDSSMKPEYLKGLLDEFEKDLQDKFSVRWHLLGADVSQGRGVTFAEKETNLSEFLDELENAYFNRNVGAAVLFTDGLYNSGKNPVYQSSFFEYPIHTVLLGDTSIQRDAAIVSVKHNHIAYLGNKFEVVVHIASEKLKGKKTRVVIEQSGNVLADTNVQYTSNQFYQSFSFYLKAEASGVQHYVIRLEGVDNEFRLENNVRHMYVEVLEGRQRILLLAAAPHPDIAAISNAITKNDKYELNVQLQNDFDSNLEPYQLLILHQLPARKGKKMVMQPIVESDIPKLYILGSLSDQQKLVSMVPGLQVTRQSASQQSLPVFVPEFSLFSLSEKVKKQLKYWPPLRIPHESNEVGNNFDPLFLQQIGSVKTPYLLWGFSKINGSKIGLITGEGLWKWRLHDYQKNDSHEHFDNLIQSTVQYLGLNENKNRFRLSNENLFQENERVEFTAELYNQSFQLVNNANVSMTITDSSGNEFERTFITSGNRYYLDAGRFEPGEYKYKASVNIGSESFTEEGYLTVTDMLLEQTNLMANNELLKNLSHNHGGESFFLSQLDSLKTLLLNNEYITAVSHYTFDIKYLIDLKWLFALFVILFTLEWYLRKRNGLY